MFHLVQECLHILLRFLFVIQHPPDAVFVIKNAKQRAPKLLLQRVDDFSALRQPGVESIDLFLAAAIKL